MGRVSPQFSEPCFASRKVIDRRLKTEPFPQFTQKSIARGVTKSSHSSLDFTQGHHPGLVLFNFPVKRAKKLCPMLPPLFVLCHTYSAKVGGLRHPRMEGQAEKGAELTQFLIT